ncbi:MAG: glycosyltransferase family 39 protein [Planctomycetota bacterium]|nr:glycosyltransferase family 39 protein [Planctomycetota bacterium]
MTSPAPPRSPFAAWAWLLLWAAVAVGFTWLQLAWSADLGRLALPPDFDDSVYMLDGLARLDAIEANGPAALGRDYVADRPHAPVSSALALGGFALFGRTDVAPYAMNALLVFLLLLGVDHLMRGAWPVARLLAAAFVLSLRFTGMLVTEFRPDIACGLLAAFGAALLLRRSLPDRPRRQLVGVGVCFGAALLMKPSVTPMTLGILGLACGVASLRHSVPGTVVSRVRTFVRAFGWVAGTALVVALPHALVHGEAVARYIWSGIWGPARVLGEVYLPLADTLRYYIDGDGGVHMLNRHVPLLAALPVVCTLWLVVRGRRRAALAVAAYGLVVAIVYAVITLNHVKTQFLGAPFFALVLLGCVLLLRGVVGEAQSSRLSRHAARAVVGTFAVVSVLLFTYPMPRALPDAFEPRRTALRGVYDAIEAHRRPTSRLLFGTIGLANGDLVQYWQRRERKPVIEVIETPLVNDWAWFEPLLEQSDLVVASEIGNSEDFPHLADAGIQRRLLAWLAEAPGFVEVARIPTYGRGAFRVFFRGD